MQGAGKDLRTVLSSLQKSFPKHCKFSEIVESVKLDKEKVNRLITYASDESLTYTLRASVEEAVTRESHRLSGKGIDKLNNWTDEDDKLII